MAKSSEVIERSLRWLALREEKPGARVLVPSNNRCFEDLRAREVYSYGRHFPLVRFVPAHGRQPARFILNGDRWPGGGFSATSRHQSETIAAVDAIIADAARTGVVIERVTIPRTALDGAAIDLDTIRPVHVRADRDEVFTCVASVAPGIIEAMRRPLPTFDECETHARAVNPRGTAVVMTETLAGSLTLRWLATSMDNGRVEPHSETGKLTRRILYRGYQWDGAQSVLIDHEPPDVVYWFNGSHELTLGDDGTVTFTTRRHWLGDSLFTAERVTTHSVTCPNHRPGMSADGVSQWCDTCGNLATARGTMTVTKRRRMRFLSSFDYNERAPLYFLCALPHSSRASTVDMAFEDLAPRAVHAAMARGLEVNRQGDVFLIPTTLTDADVYGRARTRARLTQWTRGAKAKPNEVGYVAPMTTRQRALSRNMRRRLYLETRARQMIEARPPTTPVGWRAAHRAERRVLLERLATHERRVADGDDVCECVTSRGRGGRDGTLGTVCGRTLEDLQAWARQSRHEPGRLQSHDTDGRYRGHVSARDVGYAHRGARQRGQCYNRALDAWKSATLVTNRKYAPDVDRAKIARALAIYGTAHTATEVVTAAQGVTYVRGIVRHVPALVGEFRGADHAQVKLAPGVWFLAIRNTVPRQ